jgi:hypothetical protein
VNATPGTWDAPAYLPGCSTPQIHPVVPGVTGEGVLS